MNEKIKNIQNKIKSILNKYQIKKSSIFGSFVYGKDRQDSDVDILVELGEQKGLFTLVRLKRDLENALGRKVDLLTYNSINHLLKKHILKDALKIYG